MPISETTFADRLGRAQQLQAAVATFSTVFAPADVTLAATPLQTFIDGLDTLNTETGSLVTQYSVEVDVREVMVKDVKARTLRVLSYVESNVAWARFARAIKKLADKIRGNRPRKPAAPAPGETPGSPTVKARNTGEQSFVEIADNFQQLAEAVAGIPGYAPPAAEISAANLQTLADDFSDKNKSMATLGRQLVQKQKDRLDAYDGPGGLSARMIAVKKAVRAQYGADSSEYSAVKAIKV